MVYRKRSPPGTDATRVELLRFVPTSRQWVVWAALSLALVVLATIQVLRDRHFPLALVFPLVFCCVGLTRASKCARSVVATLERDERGRAFCVYRSLFGLEWTRRWPTEETPVVLLAETQMSSLGGASLAMVATVRLGEDEPIALFESTDAADSTAFRVEALDFARLAERLPGEVWLASNTGTPTALRHRAQRSDLERIIDRDDFEALRELVPSRFAVDARVEYDEMALIEYAATRGSLRCVRGLLELGARVTPDALGLAGYGAPSPDHEERDQYLLHVEVVRVLLDSGADPEALNCHGVPVKMPLEDAGPEMAALVEARARKA